MNLRFVFLAVGLALIVLASSMSGCSRGKKGPSTYGPSEEWVDDMRDRIRSDISDPDKASQLLSVVDDIQEVLMSLDKDVQEYYRSWAQLDRNYESTRAEFDAAAKEFADKREAYFEQLLAYIFQMKNISGKEDWKTVSDIDKSLYEQWRRSPTDMPEQGGSR